MISRDEILDTLLQQFKQFFGFQVEFDKPTLETWLLQTLSILDENQLMYLSLLMNESFLSTAIFPSTIKKFASDYGYTYKSVQPASGEVDIYIALDSSAANIDAEIPFDTQFVYNDIVYMPSQKVYITYTQATNVANIRAYDLNGNKFVVPYTIEVIQLENNTTTNAIHFKLPIIQAQRKTYTFNVTVDDVVNYKFPTYTIPYPQTGSVSSFQVYVSGAPAERKQFLFELSKDTYSYVVIEGPQGYELIFGNSLIGKALNPGDFITVEVLISLGAKGNVYANTLTLATPIVNKITGSPLNVIIRHPDIMNGQDAESPNEIRLNTIKSLHSNRRLVTVQDFKNLPTLINLPFTDSKVFFTESDLYVNEVVLFGFKTYNGLPLIASTVWLQTTDLEIKQFQKLYQRSFETNEVYTQSSDSDVFTWLCPFEIKIDTDTMIPKAYFYPLEVILNYRVILEDYYSVDKQSYVKLLSVVLKYDEQNLKPYLELTYLTNVNELNASNLSENVQLELTLSQNANSYNLTIDESTFDPISKQLKLKCFIPDGLTEDTVTASVMFKYKFSDETTYETLSYIELAPFRVKYNISAYTPLKLTWQQVNDSTIQYTIYGVPVLQSPENAESDLTNLFTTVIESIRDLKMITNKVSVSFAKTYGLIENVKYSKSKLNSAHPNEFTIPLKLKLDVYVTTNKPRIDIIKEIKSILLDLYKPAIERDVILSDIIETLKSSLDYIRDLNVYLVDKDGNEKQQDIVFSYSDSDIPKDEILSYVPEVIYVTDDSIDVNVTYV